MPSHLLQRRSGVLMGLVGVGALVLAACGSSGTSTTASTASPPASTSGSTSGIASESAAQIVAASKTASLGASSVRVNGFVVSGGQHIQLNLRLQNNGSGDGQLEVGGEAVQVRLIGHDLYVEASANFYAHQGVGSVGNLLAGKWIKVPATNQDFSNLNSLLSSNTLLGQLFSSAVSTQGLTKGGVTTIRGEQAITISDPAANGGSLYVATSGPPYLLRASASANQGEGQLDFSGYGQPLNIQPPPNAVDISQLQSGGGSSTTG